MKTRIDIDTRTFVRFWLVVIAFGLVLYAINLATVGLIILGLSLILAMALNRPVSRLARRLPGKSRVGATAIAYLAVIGVLTAVLVLIVPPIVQQTAGFVQSIPNIVNGTLEQSEELRNVVAEYNLEPQLDAALGSIQNSASSWAGNVGSNLIAGIGSFFSFVAGVILVLVLTFLMLVEGPVWMKRIWGLYTSKTIMEKHKRVAGKIYNVFTGYVTGQLTVSLLGSLAAGMAVFIISLIFPSVPGALAFPTAAITFIMSLIPMFGATIGGIIITTLLAFNSIPAAIVYAIYFVVYQQVENNFIAPHIQARRIELSALAVLAAVTVGLYMFGILGGIIAIPIAGSIRVLLNEYLDDAKKRREESSDSSKKPRKKVAA